MIISTRLLRAALVCVAKADPRYYLEGVHITAKYMEATNGCVALRSWQSTKRRITARLAVLRQEEKQRSLAIHQQDNDFLIEEMKRYLPRSAFLACVHRAKLKAGARRGE